MFSLRIVNVDHYMCPPKSGLDLTYSQFRGSQIKSVPVFRVFGSTPSGNKTCLHVHGVFPYILVPYGGEEDAGRLMYQLASSLDKAINISQNTSHSSRQHVFKIVQVSGRPFYGYHSKDHQFFKIFFYNPLVVKRACDLLQNGAVCGTKFQIHEGHVPFTLQFFIDYNLYGMSFINVKSVVYRKDASPPGITSGTLLKESCCELEADAVAVDILNRLTIEGELAVNPGLAAIWKEEKQRLKRDALDVSQRPEPPLAMSEVLLREKLRENLKYQGKCKTPLKEKIPYPVETQRSSGSDILDASVLNTHSLSSLALSMPDPAEETTIIDEELVFNLTQSSLLSSSMDQSLMMALDNLAAQNEINAAVSQNVEDDSILGSQILPEQDMFGHDISDVELEALKYSLPPDLALEENSDDDIIGSDVSFDEKIPQLDGVGDFGSKKKTKQNRRRRRVLVENAATEMYPMSDGEEILMSSGPLKDDFWPESEKQETLEEIFSDEEPYNSPVNNIEDSCVSVDIGTMNVDIISSFETVLRGDPSFVSGDLASEDVMFQPLSVEDDCEKKSENLDEKKLVDKNSNFDSVPSLNNSLDPTDMLATNGDELLNTSQLDEILNEDLNKGLQSICEKSPTLEYELERPEDSPCRFNTDQEMLPGNIDSLVEYLDTVGIEDSENGSVGEVTDSIEDVGEANLQNQKTLDEFEIIELNPFDNVLENKTLTPIETIQPELNNENTPVKHQKGITSSISPPKKEINTSQHTRPKKKTYIRWTKKKNSFPGCNFPSFHMSRKEIEKYFSQLDSVKNYLTSKTDFEGSHPILWCPLRENPNIENKGQKIQTKSKAKASKNTTKKSKLSYSKQNEESKVQTNSKAKASKGLKAIKSKLSYSKQNEESKVQTNSKAKASKGTTIKSKLSYSKELKKKHQINRKIKENLKKKLKCSNEEILKLMSCKVVLKNLSLNDIHFLSKNPTRNLTKIQTDASNNNLKKQVQKSKLSQNAKKPNKTKLSLSAINLNKQESPMRSKEKKSPKTAKSSNTSVKTLVSGDLSSQDVKAKPKNTNQKKTDSSKKVPTHVTKRVEDIDILKTKTELFDEKITQCDRVLVKKSKLVELHSQVKSSKSGKKKDKSGKNTLETPTEAPCEKKFVDSQEDQSTSIEFDKKCVIKLLPLAYEKLIEIISGNIDTTSIASDNISGNSSVTQGIREASEAVSEDKTCYPLVKVEKLVISSGESVTQNKETDSNTKWETSSLINPSYPVILPGAKSQNKPSENRKRHLRIYSLDGTVDSSSSDENIEDKQSTSKPQENPVLYSTPNKRRKSKSCRSPRNYVPLNIEIKKSPKMKPKNKTNESESALERFSENTTGVAPVKSNDPVLDKEAKLKCLEKKLLKPSVLIERLPLTINKSGNAEVVDINQPSTSSSSLHPVKRLKVFVKRLSLDTPEDSPEHVRVSQLRRRFQRSFSLPATSEEKTRSKKTNLESNGSLIVSRSKYVEVNTPLTDKGTKVRKSLNFPVQEETHRDIPSASVPKRKQITERKISTDIFEASSTPESPPALSNHSETSSDFFRLSGMTKSNTPDYERDEMIIPPSLDNTILTLNLSECGSENTSLEDIDGDPHCLENLTIFTPAFYAPSRSEVLAKLRDYGLPEVVNEEPFYSDPGDVSKACEVGSTLLKLQSKSVVHMEEFEGTFGSITKWRKESSKMCYKGSSPSRSNRALIITPLKPPPSRMQAKEWLKTKVVKKNVEVPEVRKSVKITLPSSPGNSVDGDDDTDNSLTISQCTPLSKTSVDSDSSNVQSEATPEVVLSNTSKTSPLMASTPVNNPSTSSVSKRRFSRPSSGFRKSLPLIKEENLNLEKKLHHDVNSQTASVSVSDSTKLMSDSGIQRLLSGHVSPASMSCQIDAVTPDNSGNYRLELENLQDVKLVQEHQFLTILSMELHIHTRGELKPNPDHDAICCVFYNITNDCPDTSIANITGVIYVKDNGKEEKMPQFRCQLHAVADEPSLIAAFVALVRKWDPDIFVGYEIELLSWGYLLQRAYVLNLNLVVELSRVSRPFEGRAESEAKQVSDDDSEIRLTGRIVLNLWRFLRHEVALQSYTFENMMYHVLHQRVPLFSFGTLASWWAHRTKLYRWLVLDHYITRVEGTAKLMRHVDLVGRTSEFARLFGIQFYEVLSRGSQFRVESMMLRLVKPLNYVAVSPSVQQRARMRAPESLPLIMEPQSRFYTDPVIVLDFQSLYPSIIIAYNYCYSTCLGRVEHLGRSELFEFGCTQLRVPVRELLRLKGSLNFSPCGVAFINQSVVRGVMPRMLQEILNTRLMVKQSMKENKENKTLQRVLHNRQLGLKLIANVTYGYTAANFSGRMPCIELGDSVVSKARETLERAISLVSNNNQWGARVIYGDTDSMFVLVPGKSRQEAFRIGAEIAEAVTNDNPQPVKLKLEKVYQPCLLQTKKRYVGYMYESPNQEEPVYDAKGIETVRRDGCPAVAKVLEKTLRLLFETKDVSLVKRYVCRQFTKVMSGRISVQDLTFAREYRGAAGYRPGACVPALELAKQGRAVDPRSEPRVGERVPYVVVAGAPGLPLIRLVRSPSALLLDPGLRVNAEYYITRVIAPPLDRCLSLLGAHVTSWYAELPRKQHVYLPNVEGQRVGSKKATISQYFVTSGCVACGCMTSRGVCDPCLLQPQQLSVTLNTQVLNWERKMALVTKICQSCCGRMSDIDCISMDCPTLYRLYQARKDLRQADYVRSLQQEFLSF
ncbi:DNA polymerase zeta catalytic subunit [Macrosteles quadrilineatus]|uniref:DNA polymerase zeta catalytic subunit n=1 Tax=Macrosteles quadrilineatus TaxID=74068 RepID=UPI0023E31FDD|nr:DNA polymerase zeta catalytic subunit [Macrosteles quadrilineatus]XP_054272955.1 DNA polymerase zeta catalytic subunit [Macrosteles quadrilineatus]